MKQVFISSLVFLCLLSACSADPLESQPLPERESELSSKQNVPSSFFLESELVPITVDSSFVEVLGWFDDESVLYLKEDDLQATIYTHHLYNGQTSSFFEVEGWILNVTGNGDYSLFAIEYIDLEEEAHLVIVNKDGMQLKKVKAYGDGYSVFWNPYYPERFMMVVFLPNWEFETFLVDLNKDLIEQTSVDASYMQWISETEVAYLKWMEVYPSFEAPLVVHDLELDHIYERNEAVIAFIGFPEDLTVTMSVDSIYDQYTKYEFQQGEEFVSLLEVPILNTYSDQWWIPFYDYHEKSKVFYYLRPKYSSDFLSYDEGYDVIAYEITSDTDKKLMTVEHHQPISVSPNGSLLLVGNQFEKVYDFKEDVLLTVWEH